MTINLQSIIDGTKASLRRFPVCLAFLAALTVQLSCYIIAEKTPDSLTFFLSVGMLVALLLHLLTEKDSHHAITSKAAVALWGIPFMMLAADSYYLHALETIHDEMYVAQTVAVFAILIAICFLPFRKETDDRRSWHFVLNLIGGAGIGIIVGVVMFAGLWLLYYGSSVLFSFHTKDKAVGILAVLCLVTLTTLLFLMRIPKGKDLHVDAPASPFQLNIVRYLFLPLALLYTLVLYVYGIKIAVTMTLPQGMLSVLVSTLMFGILAIIFLAYPYLRNEQHRGYDVRLIRLLPLIVIPLIILMSIGIGRRFYDYGITTNRLYVLTLNVWFYAVAIGLWLNKIRRIHWVSISFSVLLILTSCHPWNYYSIYRNILLDRIHGYETKYHFTLNSVTNDALRQHFLKMTDTDARALYSTLSDGAGFDYQFFNNNILSGVYLTRNYEDFMQLTNSERKDNDYTTKYNYATETISIPAGYSHVEYINTTYQPLYFAEKLSDDTWTGGYGCGYHYTDSTFIYISERLGSITVPHKSLDDKHPLIISVPEKNGTLQVTSLRIEPDNATNNLRFILKGYWFTK